MHDQPLHTPNGEEKQILSVAGIDLPMRPMEIGGRTYMVPRYIFRNKRDRTWRVAPKAGDVVLPAESFSDGTYLGLPGKALTQAIEFLTGSLRAHQRDASSADHHSPNR
ncbi:hypothetical protein [Pseudomonas saliphila]|uniref:hypothetical protein n=1 Tax=Pseudomonas saliphila TaxID=2586906 RepID=UPI00123B6C94|nr:hypothetical protein [Pseudomonas saliphila]